MPETLDKEYNVKFVGDYFTMTVTVQGVEGDEELALDLASNLIKEYYGWDVLKASTIEIDVEEA